MWSCNEDYFQEFSLKKKKSEGNPFSSTVKNAFILVVVPSQNPSNFMKSIQ